VSGIVALFARDGSAVDADRVREMHDQLAHRGPDGGGQWCDRQIGLGHHHLQTTPEGAYDDQPVRHDSVVLTADLRLDNRDELLQQLPISKPPSQLPDSKVLLAAYKQWGTDCVKQFAGSFAFVIWDNNQARLFCARDHFGVKPFYYYLSDDTFAAASEMKGLLVLPNISERIDERKIGDLLTGVFDNKERTYYRDLTRLPPAHAMTVGAEGTNRWEYWSLDPTKTITLDSDAAYERRFRELFEQAVECRLRSAGNVGTALSGGLDSSSITVMAREQLPSETPLYTFSNVFDDAPSSDEREYIETVTERDGIESHYSFMDDVGMFDPEWEMFQYYDMPPHDTMHKSLWERFDAASNKDVNVILEGALGDSATGYGLGLLPELLRAGQWRYLIEEIQTMSERYDSPRHAIFVRNVVLPLIPNSVQQIYKRVRGEPTLEKARNFAIDKQFADRINLRNELKNRHDDISVLKETARRRQYRSLMYGMMTASLETTDIAAAACNVEPRYPFTDKRLVEFSLAMPATQQLSQGLTRSIVRRSLSDILPKKIRTRIWKADMSHGFWNSLNHDQDTIAKLIAEPGALMEFLNQSELQKSYDRFTDEKNTKDGRVLWRAFSLYVWLRTWNPDTIETAV
jgi:asparagine synthase (glutamine-hydrolysing)